jgi:hypothetical protein
MNTDRKQMRSLAWPWAWTVVAAGAALIAGAIALFYLAVAGQTAATPAAIAARTLNADNAIANYEWFKQQHEDIKAIDANLGGRRAALAQFEAEAGPRAGWTFDDHAEWSRLSSIVQGLQGQRTQMVADYNARAQMANRDLFRTRDLPDHIDQETSP